MTKLLITLNGFVIKASVGFDIRIEEDELKKAYSIWGKDIVGIFKQGSISGRYIAGILTDKEREIVKDFDPKTGKKTEGMVPLQDIFKGVEFKQLNNQNKLT